MSAKRHDHVFGQDQPRPGERRTVIVIVITAVTMAVEIVAGLAYGSMALLADGLHMGSHAAALGLALFAYIYARRRARDEGFSFGTGKVNSLAGFSGAIVLAGFAVVMLVESIGRFLNPVDIVFDQAIYVAVAGLVVNGASMLILGGHHENHDHHHHDGHTHDDHTHEDHAHEDHNLRSAYLHVLADALTSVLAIVALLAGKYLGAVWLDPVMGVLGAVLVIRWARGLLLQSGRVLLDRQAPLAIRQRVSEALEEGGKNRIYDLHVWAIGPGYYAVEAAIEAGEPQDPGYYRRLLPEGLGLKHATVEVAGRKGQHGFTRRRMGADDPRDSGNHGTG
ncbi:CDF family Co(II)/Ni(II) efflux transporter DmeF [bacterium]|nr:CDF family Co(II)/Ni(II) efflux transporter DmeF [bacterium]